MTPIDSLIKMLDAPDSDFWYDFECENARKLIDDTGLSVLFGISDQVHCWPENRLEHLAYILGSSNVEIEVQLLKILVQSNYPSVMWRARESLRSLGERNA